MPSTMQHKKNLARCHEKEQRIGKEINNARFIDFKEITGDTVTVGTEVTMQATKGKKKVKYTLLGIWDGDRREQFNLVQIAIRTNANRKIRRRDS